MKIGINATILDDKPSGLGIYTINIIRELAKIIDENDEIIVYTSSKDAFKNININVRLVTKRLSPKYGKYGGLLRFLWNQIVFPVRLRKDNVDIVYSTTHHGSFFIKKPQILTIHDLLPILFPKQHKLQYYYFKYIIPKLLKKSHSIVTVSKNTLLDIVKFYNYKSERIKVVYNSYDKQHFAPNTIKKFKDQYGDYFLFLGASYPHKNLKNAILSFINVQKKYPNIKLIIAGGKKEYRNEVINSLKIKGFDLNNIEVIDYVKYEDLPEIYADALALFYPTFYEGFGIPPLEAMACGCPVIVSNSSSLPEVCGDAAYYINPNDTETMSEALEDLLVNKEMKMSLIKKGFENTERFSWEKSAKKLLYVLKQI